MNQAWAGHPGRRVVNAPSYQVWAKALENGQAAVVFNRDDAANLTATVNLTALGLGPRLSARDVWTHAPADGVDAAAGAWTVSDLAPHDSRFVVFKDASS